MLANGILILIMGQMPTVNLANSIIKVTIITIINFIRQSGFKFTNSIYYFRVKNCSMMDID